MIEELGIFSAAIIGGIASWIVLLIAIAALLYPLYYFIKKLMAFHYLNKYGRILYEQNPIKDKPTGLLDIEAKL